MIKKLNFTRSFLFADWLPFIWNQICKQTSTLWFSLILLLLTFAFSGLFKRISFVFSTTVCLHSRFVIRCHNNHNEISSVQYMYIIVNCHQKANRPNNLVPHNNDDCSAIQLNVLKILLFFECERKRKQMNKQTTERPRETTKRHKDKSIVAHSICIWNTEYSIH